MSLLVCRNFFESCSPAASRFPLNVFFFSLSFLFPLCSLSVWYPFSLFTKFNWNSIETNRIETKRNDVVTIHTHPLSLSLSLCLSSEWFHLLPTPCHAPCSFLSVFGLSVSYFGGPPCWILSFSHRTDAQHTPVFLPTPTMCVYVCVPHDLYAMRSTRTRWYLPSLKTRSCPYVYYTYTVRRPQPPRKRRRRCARRPIGVKNTSNGKTIRKYCKNLLMRNG